MSDDFKKHLEQKYKIKIYDVCYTLENGRIITIELTDTQRRKVLLLKNKFETFIIKAELYIAHITKIPISLQPKGDIHINGNLLTLIGSDIFVDIMLFQLLVEKQ